MPSRVLSIQFAATIVILAFAQVSDAKSLMPTFGAHIAPKNLAATHRRKLNACEPIMAAFAQQKSETMSETTSGNAPAPAASEDQNTDMTALMASMPGLANLSPPCKEYLAMSNQASNDSEDDDGGTEGTEDNGAMQCPFDDVEAMKEEAMKDPKFEEQKDLMCACGSEGVDMITKESMKMGLCIATMFAQAFSGMGGEAVDEEAMAKATEEMEKGFEAAMNSCSSAKFVEAICPAGSNPTVSSPADNKDVGSDASGIFVATSMLLSGIVATAMVM